MKTYIAGYSGTAREYSQEKIIMVEKRTLAQTKFNAWYDFLKARAKREAECERAVRDLLIEYNKTIAELEEGTNA